MNIKKFILLVQLLVVACQDNNPNILRFNNEELLRATNLMNKQISLFRKIPSNKLETGGGSIWITDGTTFIFDYIDFDTVTTLEAKAKALDSLNITQQEFDEIKSGAFELYKLNVCSAFSVDDFYELNTFAFSYSCFSSDFDTSERWILLKSEVQGKMHKVIDNTVKEGESLATFYRIILDENKTMLLGY